MKQKRSYKFGDHKAIIEKEMIDLRRKGWTLQQIGDRYGISRQAVCYHLKKHGLGVRDVTNSIRVKFTDESN